MRILAIDPGNVESGWVVLDVDSYRPLRFGKDDNETLRASILRMDLADCDEVYVEMIGHYGTGMAAGKTVFDTCVWIGRFWECLRYGGIAYRTLVLRPTVKAHLCGTARATDTNVTQALVDRFTPGQKNHGKGTKAEPGWFHGFKKDIWQAYALAVYAADMLDDSVTES